MAKVEKINQTKDNIAITGDSVTFSDLTITNKELADYLAESDNMLESLESIIEIGVKTMNSLKNSIERDFTKQTFETIAEEMKKNLSDSVDDMGDEFNKYFNEDGEFVKELNENKKKMLEELNNELENFVDPSNRESAISKFQKDETCQVFVASLNAAGVGIDLTSASVVILYDRWWNAARENQAIDRVHRIGQNKGVQVFKLVTLNSIEERIDQLINKKKHLLSNVVTIDEASTIKMLSKQELYKLLELT